MSEPSPSAPRAPTPTVRVLQLDAGKVRVGGAELLGTGGILWIDVTAQDEATLAPLAQRYGWHPLAIEDCLHLEQRPKMEEYGDHLFLVQHAFRKAGGPSELELCELHSFLGKEYLATVHELPMPEVDAVFARATQDPAVASKGVDFLLYLLSDKITDSHFLVLDELADAIETLEDDILSAQTRRSIEEIFALKRALVTLRRTLSPARDVFGMLARRGDPRVGERTALYFRDVYDHLVRVVESIESDRDLLGNALDAYLSMTANRTNQIMKQLTIFSAIFLPLAFITGFFGQNFTSIMPFEKTWLFDVMVTACVAVPAAMLFWFFRKSWL
jgi:magnesium transporter